MPLNNRLLKTLDQLLITQDQQYLILQDLQQHPLLHFLLQRLHCLQHFH